MSEQARQIYEKNSISGKCKGPEAGTQLYSRPARRQGGWRGVTLGEESKKMSSE